MTDRAALYVDGFNLYHAIDDIGEPFLKWCNLWRLGEIIIPSQTEALVRAVFCTAYKPGDHSKRIRHECYVKALTLMGVECVLGHYVKEFMDCRGCGREWDKPTEKETDINLALTLMDDAVHDVYDHAYLLTCDSDQAATARLFKTRFPHKKLTSVAPPNRTFSTHITRYADGRIALNRAHIERCHIGPAAVVNGKPPVMRPREYKPPDGWIPVDQRAKNIPSLSPTA